jgi:myosin heavy subunit
MAAKDDTEGLKSAADKLKGDFDEINKSLKDTKTLLNDSISPFQSLTKISEELLAHKTNENKLSAEQLKNLADRVKAEQDNLFKSQKALKERQNYLKSEEEDLHKILKANRANSKEYRTAVKSLQSITSEIQQNSKAQTALSQQINITSGEVENLEKQLEKAATQAKKLERINKMGDALKKISTPMDDLLNPMTLLNKLINFALGGIVEYDKRLGDTAKSMNLTYGEADKSNKAMVAFAQASKSAYDNSEDLNKTVVELNKNLGTSIKFEQLTGALKEDVALMSQLENIAGLTSEESQGILKYTLATGQSAKNATPALMANYKVAGLKRGVVLNEKDTLKEISKLSNSIKLSTAGGAAGLGKAVAAAKALGADLNKVNDIAGSILNFEESIEAELSAELLTGRDLNLEKAREAALNNDLATLSDEIAKNVGSAADFSKMNRIQQDAIAKSVGMTRDELADTLTNQEALKNMGAATVEDAQKKFNLLVEQKGIEGAMAEMGENALTRQFQQTSMQDEAVQKQKQANDLLIQALGPMEEHKKSFKKILDTIMFIIEKTSAFKGILIAIGALMAAKLVMNVGMMAASIVTQLVAAKAYNRELDKQGGKTASLLGKQAALTASQVAGAEAASFGTVTVAIIAGLAAVGAAIAGFSIMNDGVIKPSGGSGHGDRVMYGPEGAISFNNKDTIVAGTDLFKANDMVSSPKGTVQVASNNNSSKEIAELRSAIMALAARPVDVSIDGTKVIEATTGMNPNTQGLESAKNSFKMQ